MWYCYTISNSYLFYYTDTKLLHYHVHLRAIFLIIEVLSWIIYPFDLEYSSSSYAPNQSFIIWRKLNLISTQVHCNLAYNHLANQTNYKVFFFWYRRAKGLKQKKKKKGKQKQIKLVTKKLNSEFIKPKHLIFCGNTQPLSEFRRNIKTC